MDIIEPPHYSICGTRTGSTAITWELARNAESQALRITGTRTAFFKKRSPSDLDAHYSLRNTTIGFKTNYLTKIYTKKTTHPEITNIFEQVSHSRRVLGLGLCYMAQKT